ncbi:MAG: dTDP-4-amino-4,6-dideoxygalactose transaminase [Flavobacteriaceae bacterium]
MIPFNKPYIAGRELEFIQQSLEGRKLSGNGTFTKKCHNWFEEKYNFNKCLLTTSCTDALEMAAMLVDIKAGDEFIVPSYTFVSTVNAFVLRGGIPVFIDSYATHPCIHAEEIEKSITTKTKVIVVVHYAGIACDMDSIMQIAEKHNLFVIEDAAQAIDSFYEDPNGNIKRLGSIGDLSTFSFHETKNISSGEGGLLVINNKKLFDRSEIIWEKGTNRSKFFRGEVDKYGWVDIGSSFLPAEIISAYLYAQLIQLESIQRKRKELWEMYKKKLIGSKVISKHFATPIIPEYASNNAHMFYLTANCEKERDGLISYLKENGIQATFHYQSLHKSPFFRIKYKGKRLVNSDNFSKKLLRLPLFYELTSEEIETIVKKIEQYVLTKLK